MIREIIAALLVIVGTVFLLLACVGVIRMPDLYLRMSATSKAGTLGSVLVLLGLAVYFNNFSIGARAFATIAFLFLTAPVAAHMIGRAAYMSGVPLWDGTVQDDLRGHYDLQDRELDSPDQVVEPSA
jgi:multicomponent Na+:H+ antiporter subunit G